MCLERCHDAAALERDNAATIRDLSKTWPRGQDRDGRAALDRLRCTRRMPVVGPVTRYAKSAAVLGHGRDHHPNSPARSATS